MRGDIRRYLLPLALGLVALCLAVISGATPSSAAAHVQGDADCSGAVAGPDVGEILKDAASIQRSACRAGADVNCDHSVNALDALIVLRYVAGSPLQQDASCLGIGSEIAGVTVSVDNALIPQDPTVPGIKGGPDRPSESSIGPDGVQVDFVADEVIYKPDSDSDLQAFLHKYGGTIVSDGTSHIAEAMGLSSAAATPSGFDLIRVDPSMSSTGDLQQNMENAGLFGDFRFSSDDAERLAAIAFREQDLGVTLDLEVHPLSQDFEEQLNAQGTLFLDPTNLSYMNDSHVPRAWDYMEYSSLVPPQQSGTFTPVHLTVIDSGFALSSTGEPLGGNTDWKYIGQKPPQWDEADDDDTAGGQSEATCSGDSSCPWHGTGAYGVCCARLHNNYGDAGSAGDIELPFVIKADDSIWTLADSIRDAATIHSDVVTISMGGDCGFWCDVGSFFDDPDTQDAINQVINGGGIVIAGAGNEGEDIGDVDFYPCKLEDVICVGGVGDNSLQNLFNYGDGVDIWAPSEITSTVTPATALTDDNDWGADELYDFHGTSAATPFVAGIVAMMRELKPDLTFAEAQTIMQETSNPSTDPKVKYGVVDALGALMQIKPDIPPLASWVAPAGDTTQGYQNLYLRVNVDNFNQGSGLPDFDGETVVTWFADEIYPICASNTLTYRDNHAGYECTVSSSLPIPIGTKSIVARVADPFGVTGTAGAAIRIVDNAPTVQIQHPNDGSTFFSNQVIKYSAYVFDPEEPIFPQDHIVWTSSIAGEIGTGDTIHVALPAGDQTVTVTATDEKGMSTSASLTVHIQTSAGIPSVEITSPPDESFFGIGDTVHLSGDATDPEDGPLTGASLKWYDSVDGFLGTGENLDVVLSGAPCFTEDHAIDLQATDSDNHTTDAQITVEVGMIC